MPTQVSYDFDKNEQVWFDIGYAFGSKKTKDPRHGYPITSRGLRFALVVLFLIVIAAIVVVGLSM